MEKIKKKNDAYALRREFIGYVMTTFFFVAFLSLVVILGCVATREWLVPSSDKMRLNWAPSGAASSPEIPNYGYVTLVPAEPDEVNPFYTESGMADRVFTLGASRYADTGVDFCLTRVHNSPQSLSPKKKLVYYGSGVAMIALPVLLSLSGILFCGFLFYEEKLRSPIDILKRSAEKISGQDLDFQIEYDARDELGELCGAFERMRIALSENNSQMWQMLEQRRQLQASVAHDLRNPIAIIKGHAEYLRLNYPLGTLSEKRVISITDNIEGAAARLMHYTESIREINRLEDLEIKREPVIFSDLFAEISEELGSISDKITLENNVGNRAVNLDKQALYRILENLVGNSLRFAKTYIKIEFGFEGDTLSVCVSDDGEGFSEKILNSKKRAFITDKSDSTHSGMGLTICRILAEKHGGELTYFNENGAVSKIFLKC